MLLMVILSINSSTQRVMFVQINMAVQLQIEPDLLWKWLMLWWKLLGSTKLPFAFHRGVTTRI